jgi:hypothetical protein
MKMVNVTPLAILTNLKLLNIYLWTGWTSISINQFSDSQLQELIDGIESLQETHTRAVKILSERK